MKSWQAWFWALLLLSVPLACEDMRHQIEQEWGGLPLEIHESGTVRFTDTEGGHFLIDGTASKKTFEPTQPLNPAFQVDGLPIVFTAKRRPDLVSNCQCGFLADISAVEKDPAAQAPLCTQELVPGLVVELVDEDLHPLPGAVVTAFEATTQSEDRLVEVGPGRYEGALEKNGLYSLRVELEGFEPLVESGLQVVRGLCHVRGQHRRLTLLPNRG